MCAAGTAAAHSAVPPANPRHFCTEARNAPLWVMTGRSPQERNIAVRRPERRPAGAHTVGEAGLLDPPQAESEHTRRAPVREIGGATAVGSPGRAVLRIAHLRGPRHSGPAPTERETGDPGLVAKS